MVPESKNVSCLLLPSAQISPLFCYTQTNEEEGESPAGLVCSFIVQVTCSLNKI